MHRTSRTIRQAGILWLLTAFATAVLLALPKPVSAADLGGDCCADLEERIGALEASTVRKPNRQIELTMTGTISESLLGFSDGVRSDAYVVTNDNDGVTLTFEGEAAEINEGPWSVGFLLEVDLQRNLSSEVSQVDDNSANIVEVGDENVWLKHEQFGTLTLGQTTGGSDGTQESDLSKTEAVSYVSVSDVGGGFLLRNSRGPSDLIDLSWGEVLDSLPGLGGALVRYDTPELTGFVLSAAWGEDDVWDVGAKFSGGIGPFKLDAGLGYAEDLEGIDSDTANSQTVTASISALHTPSGISLSLAGGTRKFTSDVELNDGSFGKPDDVSFAYGKLGVIQPLTSLGDTAFYAEYGRFLGAAGRATSAEAVAGIAGIAADDVCSGVGTACFASASTAQIWGLGVVQHIEELDAQLYLGYRHQDLDLGIVDSAGQAVASSPLNGIDLVMAGMKLEF